MKGTFIVTYPEFGTLPLAIKLLLLTSENFSFEPNGKRAESQQGGPANLTFNLHKQKHPAALNPWSMN